MKMPLASPTHPGRGPAVNLLGRPIGQQREILPVVMEDESTRRVLSWTSCIGGTEVRSAKEAKDRVVQLGRRRQQLIAEFEEIDREVNSLTTYL